MCGVAGIFAYRDIAPLVNRGELLRIREQMAARGPDGADLWISEDEKVGLAHRRLAIIDLSVAGTQPMEIESGRFRIAYNGEIYNYRALRKLLESKGHSFRSSTDTEVLLRLYAEYGTTKFPLLRGMYAFAIWDRENRALILGRDPFGIKPLYFADDGHTIRIASQVRALLAGGRVDTTPEPAGHVGFFVWGHVPDPHTLYRGIRSVPAGTTMRVDANGVRGPAPFTSIRDVLADADRNGRRERFELARSRLFDSLQDSIHHHLVADVPIGAFLSAGIDSSALVASARGIATGHLRTITLGFNEFRGTESDETVLAARVSSQYGTNHQTHWINKELFQEDRIRILERMDQPTIDGINAYFVSKSAADAGLKVAISGLGGDELFGGYPSFDQVPKAAKAIGHIPLHAELGRMFRVITSPIFKQLTSPKYASLFEYGGSYGGAYLLRRGLFMPWELPKFLDGEMVRKGWSDLCLLHRLEETVCNIQSPRHRVAALEYCWYMRNQLLRDADWAGMAHSLEVRFPYLDIPLMQAMVPEHVNGRPASKELLASLLTPDLQGVIARRRKTGFSVPTRDWISGTSTSGDRERGLRGWAKTVYQHHSRN